MFLKEIKPKKKKKEINKNDLHKWNRKSSQLRKKTNKKALVSNSETVTFVEKVNYR